MKSAVVCGIGSGLPLISVITPCVSVGTSNVANRARRLMPVAMFAPTPVPVGVTSKTSGHWLFASGATPAPFWPVQHWFAAQPAGRVPTSHAAGGTRAPLVVARSVMYACGVQFAVNVGWIAAMPT